MSPDPLRGLTFKTVDATEVGDAEEGAIAVLAILPRPDRPWSEAYVLKQPGLIGYLVTTPPMPGPDGPIAHVEWIGVSEPYRRMKVATRLYEVGSAELFKRHGAALASGTSRTAAADQYWRVLVRRRRAKRHVEKGQTRDIDYYVMRLPTGRLLQRNRRRLVAYIDEPLERLLRRTPLLLAELGVRLDDGLLVGAEELGEGSFAVVFGTADRALKITTDPRDALLSSRLLGKTARGLVRVYAAKRAPTRWAGKPAWVIVSERASQDPRELRKRYGAVTMRAFMKAAELLNEPWTRGGLCEVLEHEKRALPHPAQDLMDDVIAGVTAAKELAGGQIWDVHGQNVGIVERDGQPMMAILDMGVSFGFAELGDEAALPMAANPFSSNPPHQKALWGVTGPLTEAEGLTPEEAKRARQSWDRVHEEKRRFEEQRRAEETAVKSFRPEPRRHESQALAKLFTEAERYEVERMADEAERLMIEAEQYYERGEGQLAEEADVAAERILDRLEHAIAEAEEHETQEGEAPDPMEELARMYAEAQNPHGYAYRTKEELAGAIRSTLASSAHWQGTELLQGASDEELIEVAKDAYESRRGFIERHRKAAMAPNPNPLPKATKAFDHLFAIVSRHFNDFGTLELELAPEAHDGGRHYARCARTGKSIVIGFASEAEELNDELIMGLMSHEFGHALDFRYGRRRLEKLLGRLPADEEKRADAIAERVFDIEIEYATDRLVQCVGSRCQGIRPRPAGLR